MLHVLCTVVVCILDIPIYTEGSTYTEDLCTGLFSCGFFNTVHVNDSTSWDIAFPMHPRVIPGHLSETQMCSRGLLS